MCPGPAEGRDAAHLWDIVRPAEAVADSVARLGHRTEVSVLQEDHA
jgi:hypothetical protein